MLKAGFKLDQIFQNRMLGQGYSVTCSFQIKPSRITSSVPFLVLEGGIRNTLAVLEKAFCKKRWHFRYQLMVNVSVATSFRNMLYHSNIRATFRDGEEKNLSFYWLYLGWIATRWKGERLVQTEHIKVIQKISIPPSLRSTCTHKCA